MAVKVLIKRRVSAEKNKELDILLRQLRAHTLNQKGYISGETFARMDQEGTNLVISTWQTLDDWRNWWFSPERKVLQDQIDALLGAPTEYEVFENV
ncbi:MAG: antibiotic biosynthesis monooxygenase [Desulfobulbaceae bacterium]|nr:antibiotic biosynthesis monooxygenase [Desulfobulbaceae bacterium]